MKSETTYKYMAEAAGRYPNYIAYLIQDLKFTEEPLEILLQYSSYAVSDKKLLKIYQSLGYSEEIGGFSKSFTNKEVLAKLQEYNKPPRPNPITLENQREECTQALLNGFVHTYIQNKIYELADCLDLGLETSELENDSLGRIWAEPVVAKQVDQQSSCESVPKANKGLKYLASKVKSLIYSKGFDSYREVTDALIEEMEISEVLDRKKEEKNILRRVYDTLNVLLAADVIVKNGKKHVWKHSGSDYNDLIENRIIKKKMKIEAKRDYFNDMVHKYVATHHLLSRNKERFDRDIIKIPFVLVATEESPENFIRVDANPAHTELSVRFRKPIKVLGDLEVLTRLNMKMYFNGLPVEVLDLLKPSN